MSRTGDTLFCISNRGETSDSYTIFIFCIVVGFYRISERRRAPTVLQMPFCRTWHAAGWVDECGLRKLASTTLSVVHIVSERFSLGSFESNLLTALETVRSSGIEFPRMVCVLVAISPSDDPVSTKEFWTSAAALIHHVTQLPTHRK